MTGLLIGWAICTKVSQRVVASYVTRSEDRVKISKA